jgi:ATP-dependent helicase/nuclease subunit A
VLERLLCCENLAELERLFPTVVWGRLPSKKDDSVDPIKREIAKDLRAKIKAGVDKMKDGVFQTGLTLFVRQGLACREVVSVLIDLVQEFNRRMQEKKQEKKILDFSDAEHFALDILYVNENGQMRPSPVAKEYRQHFVEVMTDEYQDSNMVQEYLLKAVSGEDEGIYNRFMVGDVKQCIYRFRLARPELFLEKYKTFAEEGPYRRIDLAMNFRSRKEVVQSVNDVFGAIMSEQVGGIPYDERAALYVGAKFPENTGVTENTSPYQTELLLVEKPLRDEEESEREREAQAVAHRIKELRKSLMVQDKESKSLRPVRYSDMVILLRSNKGWDEVFKRTLEAAGIPVYITSKTGYFSAPEVQDLLQTLRVLDNPTQDIPLFGMMKSLFGGFTEEEIAKIRSYKKHVPLYEAIQEFATQSEDATAPKAKAFLECIQAYRKQAFYLPVRDLLTRLVSDFDYLNYVTALPAGAKRRANVEMLFTKAGEFEKSSYSGLFSFVRYVEQLEKCEVDYGEADTLDENADVVRIMSIHKSKGLEFPVVFVSGLAKKINKKDMDQGMIADMDLGLAVDYADSKRRVKNKTFRRHAISKKMLDDSLAEELRLLYVAFTRAKEKLILTSVYKDAKEEAAYLSEAGAQTFTYADYMGAVSCMDWLQKVVGGTSICIRGLDGEDLAEYELGRQVDLGVRKLRLQDAGKEMDQEALEKLKARLAAPYAYQNLESLYTKTTVSELKIAAMADKDEAAFHTFEEKDFKAYVPSFRKEEESISGTVRGNAYHRVMELMDFDAVLPAEEEKTCIERIKCFLEAEKESMRLPAQYAEAVHPRTLYRFMHTELAKRMQRAMHEGMLHREQPFVLGLPANKLGEQFPADETVLIQGIIDVYFEEEDGLVLLDYKTDSVPELDDLWKRYETQLDYYKEALERITGKRVKERILYSFHLHEYENERNTK